MTQAIDSEDGRKPDCATALLKSICIFASVACVIQVIMKSLTQCQYLVTRVLVYFFTLRKMRGNHSIKINISRCTRCTHVLTEVLHRVYIYIYIYIYHIACLSIVRFLPAVRECDVSQNNSHRTFQT